MSAPGDGSGVSRHGPSLGRRAVVVGGAAVAAVALGGVIGLSLAPRPAPTSPPAPDAVAPTTTPALSTVERMLATPLFSVAHRGGSADGPEMSAWVYDGAARASVDALEMSVVRTADGVWFGAHDRMLDRVAGVSGFDATQHTWAQVQELRIQPTAGSATSAQPFLRLEDFVARFHERFALWIDPKAMHRRHYPELMDLLAELVSDPAAVYVAKCDAAISEWGHLAQARGIQSWGFYYARDLAADPDLFARTQGAWSMLGLDVGAGAEVWERFVADGRPVVAHVVSDAAQLSRATSYGARGVMLATVSVLRG